jgi:hypothetical protein
MRSCRPSTRSRRSTRSEHDDFDATRTIEQKNDHVEQDPSLSPRSSLLLLMWPLALSMGCATHNRAAADPPPAAGCHLIPDPLQAAAPFYEPGGAYAQHPLEVSHARQTWRGGLVGAEVRIRATPCATAEYLERVLWCHAIGSGRRARSRHGGQRRRDAPDRRRELHRRDRRLLDRDGFAWGSRRSH